MDSASLCTEGRIGLIMQVGDIHASKDNGSTALVLAAESGSEAAGQ